MVSSIVVGQTGVHMAVVELLKNGYGVATPTVDTGHDLIAYEDGAYWRIQVKAYGKRKVNVIHIKRGSKCDKKYCKDTVDAIALCSLVTGDVKFASVDCVAGKHAVSPESPCFCSAADLRNFASHVN